MKTKKDKKQSVENKTNYRIFRVEETEDNLFPKKITMKKIYANDLDDANDQLKAYIRLANKEYKYYVEQWSPTTVIRNGKKYTYDDPFDMCKLDRSLEPWYIRIWDRICIECYHYFISKPKDVYYWFRDLFYLIKHKQEYRASWCLDSILLETIAFNIPILKKYKHTLSWAMLDKAILEENKDDKDFNLEAYNEKHRAGYSKKIEDRAIELEREMFDRLVDDIKAYQYYREDKYLYIDKKNKEEVELDKKLRPTLPLIKGSYDQYDYKKLNSMMKRYWNRIWDTLRMYGEEFND